MGRRALFAAASSLAAAALVACAGVAFGPRWATGSDRFPDNDALQLGTMASKAFGLVERNLPDGQLRAVRIEPGQSPTYSFSFQGGDPGQEVYSTIRVVDGQEQNVGGGAGAINFARAVGPLPAGGVVAQPLHAGDVVDLGQLVTGPSAVIRVTEGAWPGCSVSAMLLHASGPSLYWTVYCTLPDRRIVWGYVDNDTARLAPQPLPPVLPPVPARLSLQPPAGAPVDTGCLNGKAVPASFVGGNSETDAEAAVSHVALSPTGTMFADGPPPPRLGQLLSARPVSFTSSDTRQQNLVAWLMEYEWLSSDPADHATRFYALVNGVAVMHCSM